MGYYTWYSMEARHIKNEEEFNSLVSELRHSEIMEQDDNGGVFSDATYYDDSHIAYFAAYDEAKWYDHTYDMVKISKLFPDIAFRLRGDGEERGDMWYEYFQNGYSEMCPAHVTFDKPTEIEWEE